MTRDLTLLRMNTSTKVSDRVSFESPLHTTQPDVTWSGEDQWMSLVQKDPKTNPNSQLSPEVQVPVKDVESCDVIYIKLQPDDGSWNCSFGTETEMVCDLVPQGLGHVRG